MVGKCSHFTGPRHSRTMHKYQQVYRVSHVRIVSRGKAWHWSPQYIASYLVISIVPVLVNRLLKEKTINLLIGVESEHP